MTPVTLIDPVTDILRAFLARYAPSLIAEVQIESLGRRSGLTLPYDPVTADRDQALKNLGQIQEKAQIICGKYDFAWLLVLFRKMPHELGLDLLRNIIGSGRQLTITFRAAYPEAVLFGTNCILKFGQKSSSISRYNDRYSIRPTDTELRDVTRLFLLCVVHRFELFYLNSISRRDLTSPISLDILLNIYNRRLERRWTPKPTTDIGSDAIILPLCVHALPIEKRMCDLKDPSGNTRALFFFANYVPLPCVAEAEFSRYSYLDTSDFDKLAGVSFHTFRSVWLSLNQLLTETFPMLWPDSHITAVSDEILSAKLVQADDYCETALGGGYPESIWDSCYQIIGRKKSGHHPTRAECKSVVNFLTYKKFDGDVRFTEQPWVFYSVSDRLLFWDYFRHGGLLRCLARKLTRTPAARAIKMKGAAFEEKIRSAVALIPDVHGARRWVLRRDRRTLWEVDVGFVYNGILFLIEGKNEQKNERYYFEGAEVSHRVARQEALLERIDKNLGEYKDAARSAWNDIEPVVGGICIVCTEEAEFIANIDTKTWLNPYEIPRICLLSELLKFLGTPGLSERVQSHPAFVSFVTSCNV